MIPNTTASGAGLFIGNLEIFHRLFKVMESQDRPDARKRVLRDMQKLMLRKFVLEIHDVLPRVDE